MKPCDKFALAWMRLAESALCLTAKLLSARHKACSIFSPGQHPREDQAAQTSPDPAKQASP